MPDTFAFSLSAYATRLSRRGYRRYIGLAPPHLHGAARSATARCLNDHPSIDIILCTEKDGVEVEYTLRTKENFFGAAEYQLQSKLPAKIKGRPPLAKQLAEVFRAALLDSLQRGR